MKAQGKNEQNKGVPQFFKSHLLVASSIGKAVRTTLGPTGKDKLICKENGEIVITNDGANLLRLMKIEHPIGQLLVNLSDGQDKKIGDGTTSVVVFTASLCEHSLPLLERGIKPHFICNGYGIALQYSLKILEELAIKIQLDEKNKEHLQRMAITPLNSKFVSKEKEKLGALCVEAVLQISDLERKDCNLSRIKFEWKEGGALADTCIYQGVILKKSFSHENMPKIKENAIIAVLSCALEPRRPKSNYAVNISSLSEYEELHATQANYYSKAINKLLECKVNTVICQWGIDHEINSQLYRQGIVAIRWVSGDDIERIAIATGATICSNLDQLSTTMLGMAGKVSEKVVGNDGDQFVIIEDCKDPKSVRGGSKMACNEAITSLYDCICVVRNCIIDNRILVGGGSVEIELHRRLLQLLDQVPGIEQYAVKSFANALLSIPSTLAENSGLSAMETCSNLLKNHVNGSIYDGVDVINHSISNLKEVVREPFLLKESVLSMATEMTCSILKIEEIIKL